MLLPERAQVAAPSWPGPCALCPVIRQQLSCKSGVVCGSSPGRDFKSVWGWTLRDTGQGRVPPPTPACVWSHTRHRLARTPFHAQLSLTCWSLPLSRKPGRAPKAMAKPQRVISSGLCSSARYFSTSPSEKKPQGDPQRPRVSLPALHRRFRSRSQMASKERREEGLRLREVCFQNGINQEIYRNFIGWL